MKKFYITTPIYYPNARPHVGSAYTTIVCDVVARYKRMCGYDVAFLTGTDEHGEKLARSADAAGMSPAAFVAEKRQLFTKLWDTLGIPAYSAEHPAGYRFVHTSQNPDHVKSVHWMIRQAQKAGYIDRKKYEGRYCIFDERYVSDSTEPANCDICGRPAELISEENYFFKLSAFQDRLLKLYEEQPEFVQPDYRRNEVVSFVESGLRDISISRKRLKWGIPWPDDPNQVVYVWYDALTSYLTGIGFRGLDETEANSDFHKYWMDPDSERVHMIGKDILRFHAVYWPAFLMAAGLPLPKTIFAHGWIYYEQDKMSKSKGNVVYPEPIVEALNSLGAPGNDALRYYLLRDTPFGEDASFSYEGLIQRYDSDLAKGLGNLASRIITMLNGYLSGLIPKPPKTLDADDENLKDDKNLNMEFFGEPPNYLGRIQGSYCAGFDGLRMSLAAASVQLLTSKLDAYLSKKEPWKMWAVPHGDSSSFKRILYVAADTLRALAVLLYPIAPRSANRLWQQLGCEEELPRQNANDLKWRQLKSDTKVSKPAAIFPRLDKGVALARLKEFAEKDLGAETPRRGVSTNGQKKGTIVEDQPERTPGSETERPTSSTGFQPVKEDTAKMAVLRTPGTQPPAPSTFEKISIDDFAKVEMRVGEVLAAERIPKADKLLKLQVDIGTEVRQVLAGIAEYYEPEKLVGMKVVVVTNLQPRKMRGLESNGMIVAASAGEEGKPVLATFLEDVPKGARLK